MGAALGTGFDALEWFGKPVYSAEHHCIAIAGSCVVTYSTQPPNEKYFSAWNAAVVQVSSQQSSKISVVTIIDSNARIPDESERALIRGAMKRYAPSIQRFGYVIEGRGFAAAAMRSAISLTSLAARTPYRQKVFATVEEAGVWLARTSADAGDRMDAKALSSLAQAMRARVNGLARTS